MCTNNLLIKKEPRFRDCFSPGKLYFWRMEYPDYTTMPLRENATRARLAIVFFWVHMGLSALTLCCVFYLMFSVKEGLYDENMQLAATGLLALTVITLVVTIISIVFFIQWMRRAYYNLHSLGTTGLRHTEGWAAGAWFIPFLNWVWPYEIMKDIWHATQQMAYLRNPQQPGYKHEPGKLVGWWWAFFILKGILGYVASFMEPASFNAYAALGLLAIPAELIGLKIAIDLIKRVSIFEKRLYDSYSPLTNTDKYVISNPL